MGVRVTQVPLQVLKIIQGAINSTHGKSLIGKVVGKKGIKGVH